MKTLQELYGEIQQDDALKEKFIAAAKENTLAGFLAEHDCDAQVRDVMAFMRGIKERALSDDEMDKVAGGCSSGETFGCSTIECRPTQIIEHGDTI